MGEQKIKMAVRPRTKTRCSRIVKSSSGGIEMQNRTEEHARLPPSCCRNAPARKFAALCQ
jgi:hypothetical protein